MWAIGAMDVPVSFHTFYTPLTIKMINTYLRSMFNDIGEAVNM